MISCQLQMTGSSFQAFGGNEYKCELPVVQLSFLFSLEPPLPSSYQSGTVLPFIVETEVKGLYWLVSGLHPYAICRTVGQTPWCPMKKKKKQQQTDGYCFTKATVSLDVFIGASPEIRTK